MVKTGLVEAIDSLVPLDEHFATFRGNGYSRKGTKRKPKSVKVKVKNPVYHSRTKHIEIRHHFIRDCYEKRLIDVVKIHTDNNVADLLTKGFDVTRFNFLVMTTLKYSDKHNMVAFLKKPNESVGFTKIVDFLKGTSLSEYTITEASVRSKLQLEDVAGISNLPDAKIYDGLATLGYVSEGKLTFWKKNFTPQRKFLIHTILHCLSPKSGGWDQFGSPIATALICLSSNRVYNFSKLIFDGMVHNIESNTKFLMYPRFLQMILGITTENNGKYLAPTLTKKLFANRNGEMQGISNIAGLLIGSAAEDQGHTSGSAEDSLQLKELMVLVPKLVTRIANLEKELHQTKTTYGKAVLTLVERVKSLEVALKRKTKKVVVSDSEDEETENQGRKIQDIDDDPLVSLVRESMKEKDTDFVTPTKISASGEVQEQDISPTTLEAAKTLSQVISQKAKSTDKGIRYKRKTRSKSIEKDISTDLDAGIEVNPGSEDFNTGNEDFNTGSLGVSTGSGPVSTPSVVQTINVTIPSPIKSQREGKAPMTTEEIQATKRTKAQIQQEEAGLAEAMRLQALQEEEAARQVHLDALIAKRILEEEELSEQQKKRKAKVQEAAQFYTEED
ncbi:hypothetical protein Tco_0340598 [Tanacetum coccineum]